MKTWSLVLLLATLLGACRQSTEARDPVWGKQACEHCRMLVSDPVYAAQLVDRDGQRMFFDDIGCLVEYLKSHGDSGQALWVREGQTWRPARTALYKGGAPSPMDYGFVAAQKGDLDFEAVRRNVQAKTHGHEHDHGTH